MDRIKQIIRNFYTVWDWNLSDVTIINCHIIQHNVFYIDYTITARADTYHFFSELLVITDNAIMLLYGKNFDNMVASFDNINWRQYGNE